jgi:hypothetical protein
MGMVVRNEVEVFSHHGRMGSPLSHQSVVWKLHLFKAAFYEVRRRKIHAATWWQKELGLLK